MTLKELTAVFTVYSNNFKIMHWGAIGSGFDRIHKLAEEYYDMTTNDLDILAEMALRLNQNPATLYESAKILENIVDHQYFIFEEFSDVDYHNFVKIASMMLRHICKNIENVLDESIFSNSENVGIKAELEGMHNRYDIQYRYLNARRAELADK